MTSQNERGAGHLSRSCSLILDASPLCGSPVRLTAAWKVAACPPPPGRGPVCFGAWCSGPPPGGSRPACRGSRPGWLRVIGAWSPRSVLCAAGLLPWLLVLLPSRCCRGKVSHGGPAWAVARSPPPRSICRGLYPLGRGNFSFAPAPIPVS